MKHICPICRRPTATTGDDFPFCSERCRLVDLGNWASERYVVSDPVFDDDALEELLEDKNHPQPNDNDDSDSDDASTGDSTSSGKHDSH